MAGALGTSSCDGMFSEVGGLCCCWSDVCFGAISEIACICRLLKSYQYLIRISGSLKPDFNKRKTKIRSYEIQVCKRNTCNKYNGAPQEFLAQCRQNFFGVQAKSRIFLAQQFQPNIS